MITLDIGTHPQLSRRIPEDFIVQGGVISFLRNFFHTEMMNACSLHRLKKSLTVIQFVTSDVWMTQAMNLKVSCVSKNKAYSVANLDFTKDKSVLPNGLHSNRTTFKEVAVKTVF